MGNQQIYPKRVHRLSEAVGFLKDDHDDDRFVTINKQDRRALTKSAPPLEENQVTIPSTDCSLVNFSTPALPFDAYATITGTFTDWIEHKMTKADGQYTICIRITHGCHHYRILVNGRARFQPHETIEDHHKYGRVNFIYVAPSDQNIDNHLERTALSLSKLNDWSQEINPTLSSADQPPPPRIPPHLLNILLNRKLPAHCDPHLLPEPNTVMLRHLYALSIQNGIMILSTTIRYKRKFVTLCFYKPT